jgi:hypothetical protein
MLESAELREQLRDVVPAERVTDVAGQLVALTQLEREQELSANEIVDSLTDSLLRLPPDAAWSENDLRRWRELREPLVELLSQPNLATIAQAVRLSFDYANVLTQARILTDIRPLFNDDADKVLGAVVSQTLRVS